MDNIILFPHERIIKASAEIFARRACEWYTEETPNQILESMAGNPLPSLGITKIYDYTQSPLSFRLREIMDDAIARILDEVNNVR